MTVAAATSPGPLTHYLRESPDLAARQLNRRALMWNIAAKATLVALFAVTSAVMIMTVLGTAIFSPAYLTLAIGLAIATPTLYHIERKFANRWQQLKYEARVEQGVASHLRPYRAQSQIEGFAGEVLPFSAFLAAFCRKHRVMIKTGQDMLPLIARFHFWQHVAESSMSEARLYLDARQPGNKLVNQTREIRHLTRQHGWRILEEVTLPAKLQSAVILRLLANPFQEIDLAQTGHQKSRAAGQAPGKKEFDGHADYFEFTNARPPLTIQEIISSDPDRLCQKLFGP